MLGTLVLRFVSAKAIPIASAYSKTDPKEGAERAKAALIGDPKTLQAAADGDVRSVGKLVGRLSQGHVGIPELGALACETALPPPLQDAEYAALCAVWGEDALDIPPNLLKFLVTASIFGPRLLTHETIGPKLRELGDRAAQRFGLGGEPEKKPAPAIVARPAKPAPAPPTNNKPEPEPAKPPSVSAVWDNV